MTSSTNNKTSKLTGNLKSQWSHAKDSTLSKMKRAARHLATSIKDNNTVQGSQSGQQASSRKHLPYQMYTEPLSPSVNASLFPFAQEGTSTAPAPAAETLDHQRQENERREAMESAARSWEQAQAIGSFARDSTTMELCALPAARPTRFNHGSTQTRRPQTSHVSSSQTTRVAGNSSYRHSWSPTGAVEPLYAPPRPLRAATWSPYDVASAGMQKAVDCEERTPEPDSDNESDDGEDDGIYLAHPVSY